MLRMAHSQKQEVFTCICDHNTVERKNKAYVNTKGRGRQGGSDLNIQLTLSKEKRE